MTAGIRKGGENLKRKKCYIYTRVSTAAQTEGYSLDAQQKRLKDFAEYKGLEIAGEYCDAGKSGHSIKGRSAFMEMMDNITRGKDDVSFVLVFKLFRFGRNAADVLSESYDQQYEKLQAEVDAAYDRIGRIEEKIEKLKRKLLRLKQGIHSSNNICLILDHFDRLYEKMNYEERRTLCRQFIQRIDVFPEKGDDPDEMVVFTLDCSRLPVTAAESKATYVEIKAHVLRMHGLKVSSLYIAQVKRKYGIEVGAAYNKPEKNKNHIPRCPKEKELAILDALKAYRMIPGSTEYYEEAAE